MATAKVKSFSVVRDVLGAEVVDVELGEAGTLGSLLDSLAARYGAGLKRLLWDGETGRIEPFLVIVNGVALRSTADLDRKIEDSSEVAIMFPVGGG
jgi:MoaD family protein